MSVFYTMFFLTLTFHQQAEVFAKVEDLFKDAPDLSSAFRDFLPGAGGVPDSDGLGMLRGPSMRTGALSGEHARAQKRKQPAEPAPASTSAPTKRRRKAADRDKEKDRDTGRASGSRVSVYLVYLRLLEMINAPTSLNNIPLVASRRSLILAPSLLHHHRADLDTPTHTRPRPRHPKTSHSKVQPLPHLLRP